MLNLDLVSTNVLGDATGFSRGDAGLTDRIEEAGLAVVDVAHDGDDRGTANEMLEIFLFDHLDGLLGRLFDIVLKYRHAEFLCHSFDGWHVQGLRDRGNDPLKNRDLMISELSILSMSASSWTVRLSSGTTIISGRTCLASLAARSSIARRR